MILGLLYKILSSFSNAETPRKHKYLSSSHNSLVSFFRDMIIFYKIIIIKSITKITDVSVVIHNIVICVIYPIYNQFLDIEL